MKRTILNINLPHSCYDMGGQYFGYAADITTSFPANGVFTEDQKLVYETVLEANRRTRAACKPGVTLYTIYTLGLRVLLEELKAGGLLIGEVDDMMANNLARVFQPHGLSHFLGLDVHDVGGTVSGFRNPEKMGPRFIRPMAKGMVFTIEPGCYFIDQVNEIKMNTQFAKKKKCLGISQKLKISYLTSSSNDV